MLWYVLCLPNRGDSLRASMRTTDFLRCTVEAFDTSPTSSFHWGTCFVVLIAKAGQKVHGLSRRGSTRGRLCKQEADPPFTGWRTLNAAL